MASSNLIKTLGALIVGGLMAHAAQALTITGNAVNVQDTTAGQDLWRIDYMLSGPVQAFHGLNLLFPVASFVDLDLLGVPPVADWVAALSQGDPLAGFDGLLALTAQQDLAAGAKDSLSLTFVALGPVPKMQGLEFFDDSFNTVPGAPVALVPEPSTGMLFVAGALALGWRRRRSRFATMNRAALAAA